MFSKFSDCLQRYFYFSCFIAFLFVTFIQYAISLDLQLMNNNVAAKLIFNQCFKIVYLPTGPVVNCFSTPRFEWLPNSDFKNIQ